MTQKPNIPKGTRDFGHAQMNRRNYIFSTIRSVFSLYGYNQIETPAMELMSSLMGKYGEEGDKLLFRIQNSGEKADKAPEKHLGEDTIIGITVADAAQVPFVPRTAIDYIAVASDNLDTCHKVMEQTRAAGLEEPVIAPFAHATPLASLMATGVNGIAAHNTTTPPAMIPQLLKELNTLLEQRLKELD